MGLSIHYTGHLRSEAALPELVNEVNDIVLGERWPYHVFETEFPPGAFEKEEFHNAIYGIRFTPPNSETFDLCFLSNGKLVSFVSWYFYQHGKPIDGMPDNWISVKTQFAGAELHKLVIHLLDYLSKKYFGHFELMDEGQYWETRDEKLLEKKFEELDFLINSFANALESGQPKKGENMELYLMRILQKIHKQQYKRNRGEIS